MSGRSLSSQMEIASLASAYRPAYFSFRNRSGSGMESVETRDCLFSGKRATGKPIRLRSVFMSDAIICKPTGKGNARCRQRTGETKTQKSGLCRSHSPHGLQKDQVSSSSSMRERRSSSFSSSSSSNTGISPSGASLEAASFPSSEKRNARTF